MTPNEITKELLKVNKIILGFLAVLALVVLVYVIAIAKSILLPFAIAVFISYILYPVIEFFESKKVPSVLSVILTVFISLLILSSVITLISGSINSFSDEFSTYEPRLQQLSNQFESYFPVPSQNELINGPTEDNSLVDRLLDNFSIPTFISSVISSVSGVLSNLVMITIIILFMLMSRKQLATKISVAFQPSTATKLSSMITNMNKQIRKYIIAKTIISLITSILVAIVLTFFGVEFVVIWAVLTFILNFIPSVGSIISTVLPLVIVFLQFENPFMVMWVGIFLLVIQFSIGNIIEPRYLGKSINLSPLVILFSLIFWGWVWGIIGMFLSVPITVIIKIILENISATKPLAILMGGAK